MSTRSSLLALLSKLFHREAKPPAAPTDDDDLERARELLKGWEIERQNGHPRAEREIARINARILALQRHPTQRKRAKTR